MKALLFFLALLLCTDSYAVVIAKKPYHDDIYIVKQRTLTIAIEVTDKSVFKEIFTKPWEDQVNQSILDDTNRQAILDKMDEYNKRVLEIKKHLDIKFVSWRDTSLSYHPAFKMRKGSWERFPNKKIERHRWLDFFEWYINQWNYDDNMYNWDTLNWALRADDRIRENGWKREFAVELVNNNPERYQYTFYDTQIFNYYSLYDNYKQQFMRLDQLGYEPKQQPTKPDRPQDRLCPIDKKYIFNKKRRL